MAHKMRTRLPCYHAGDYAVAQLAAAKHVRSLPQAGDGTWVSGYEVDLAYAGIQEARRRGVLVDIHA